MVAPPSPPENTFKHVAGRRQYITHNSPSLSNINSPFFSADTAAESKTQGQTKLQPMIRKKQFFGNFAHFGQFCVNNIPLFAV